MKSNTLETLKATVMYFTISLILIIVTSVISAKMYFINDSGSFLGNMFSEETLYKMADIFWVGYILIDAILLFLIAMLSIKIFPNINYKMFSIYTSILGIILIFAITYFDSYFFLTLVNKYYYQNLNVNKQSMQNIQKLFTDGFDSDSLFYTLHRIFLIFFSICALFPKGYLQKCKKTESPQI